jgi:hypothetical protein
VPPLPPVMATERPMALSTDRRVTRMGLSRAWREPFVSPFQWYLWGK